MTTLYDFGMEIQKIRAALNDLEVKGEKNASILVYCSTKCNEIVNAINQIAKSQQHENGALENNTEGDPIEHYSDVS